MRVRAIYSAAREALSAGIDNGVFHFARSTSYSALLALLPVITSLAAILISFRARSFERLIAGFLSRILPPGTSEIVVTRFTHAGQRSWALVIVALAVAVIAASTVITTLMDGFNAAYSVRSRPFFRQWAIGILLVFVCAIPLVAALSLVLFGEAAGNFGWSVVERAYPSVHPFRAVLLFSKAFHFAITFAATVALSNVLYRFAPNRRQKWRAVWPGAVLATLLWMLITLAFGWYVRNISDYNIIYGSIGASMALLIWMFLLSAASLLGCEFNAALERARAHSAFSARLNEPLRLGGGMKTEQVPK